MAKKKTDNTTEFLNVDLDLYAVTPLDPLVQAVGEHAFVMFIGRERRGFAAHLELAGSGYETAADRTVSCTK